MKLRTKRTCCVCALVVGVLFITAALWLGAGSHDIFPLEKLSPRYAFLRPLNDWGLLLMLAGFCICAAAQGFLFFMTSDHCT